MRKSSFWAVAVLVALPAFAQRLPENVVPKHYRVMLAPDLASEKFSGNETIEVELREPSATITLNSAEIDFDDVSITSHGVAQNAKVSLDAAKEQATLTVAAAISGPASIDISFRGILNDQLRGFYISKTPRRKYAATQFETTDARRAFPSFDEPAMKATFDVSVVIDKGDVAIGTSRVISDTPGPGEGKHTVTFARTKPLPTYLIALLVGDFQCTEGGTDGIPVRICTTPDKVYLTHFALDATSKELHFLNDWYGIKYPFEKLDVIGIPDFAAGAMENAAAMTFRESALLVDEKDGSMAMKKRVASVISHELAHQWFGDLVTMRWWDDIWLNEGFATWMAPKGVAALNSAWSTPATDAQATNRSLTIDSLASIRAIRIGVETPAEIDSVFDGIAYGKAAAVLRMVESYAGPELFRSGVNAYLKKFSYGNASSEDFWNTMTETTKQPLDRVLSSFVLQAGAPLVSVATKCEGDTTQLTLTQRRFFANRADLQAGSKEIWTIPIVAHGLDDDRKLHRLVLDQPSKTFSLPGCTPHLFINTNGRGYYRSEYAPAVLGTNDKLRRELNAAEKVSLLSDEWSLVRAGEKNVAEYLQRVEALLNDHDPAIVATTVTSLDSIGDYLTTDADRAAYRAWVRRLLSPIAKKVGWSSLVDEDDDTETMRSLVMAALAETGDDPEVKKRAHDLALKVIDGTARVDPQFATSVLRMAAETGDAAFYEDVLARALKAKSPEEYRMYLGALESFGDPVLVRRSLELALSPKIRSQDRALFLAAVLNHDRARPVAWPYVKEHWSELEKSLPPFVMGKLMTSMQRACTPEERDDVKTFFAGHTAAGTERTARATVERITNCIAFHQQQAPNLEAFLGESK
jgi:aminopeptidase N